jgi:lipopolysaccharide export system permease protein
VKIIHKYVLREHAGPLTFSLSALTSLLLINYIAKRFGELVGKGLPTGIILQFFYLSIPFTVAMTLPMSVLVATLYAFSRLAAENEITALKANGVSMVRLLVPVIVSAAFLSAGMVWFNDRVLPKANHKLRTLQGDIARKKPTFALRERIINEVSPGRFWLQTNRLDQYTGRMREITIYDISDPLRRRTIYADSGDMAFAPNGDDLVLALRRGYMLEVPKEDPAQLQRMNFDSNYVLVAGVANQLDLTLHDSYKSDREMSICELQNEVSRGEHEFDNARDNLRVALQSAAREAISGTPAQPKFAVPALPPSVPGAPAPRSKRLSLGRVYCDVVGPLQRPKLRKVAFVRSVFAATLPQQDTGKARPDSARARQDTTRPRPDSTRVRADSLPASVAAPLVVRDSLGNPMVPSIAMPTATPTPGADSLRTPPVALPAPGLMANVSPMPFIASGQIEQARAQMIDQNRLADQYAVELHKKIAISVACIVFVLIGAPIALRFPRGGVGLVIGVSLVVFSIYYVGLIAGEALADRDILTPFWAMWSTNILFTAVGLLLLARMGRESATSRGGDLREMLDIVRNAARGLVLRGRATSVETTTV